MANMPDSVYTYSYAYFSAYACLYSASTKKQRKTKETKENKHEKQIKRIRIIAAV